MIFQGRKEHHRNATIEAFSSYYGAQSIGSTGVNHPFVVILKIALPFIS